MKTTKTAFLSALLVLGPLPAAPGEDFRTDINPALLYYRSFLLSAEPISQADRDYLASKRGREQKLPERFGRIVADSDNQFGLVRRAVSSTVPCEWGIDLVDGPNITLPYLARAKGVCLAAQVRAAWALQHGRQENARDDLIAALVLGRNAANDGLLISAFVQNACEGLCYATVAQRFGDFSTATLKQLVDGFDAAPSRHTIAASIATEKKLGDWSLRKVLECHAAYPGDDAKALLAFRDSGLGMAMDFIGHTNFWPRLLSASGGTCEGVIKLLHEAEPLFPRLTQVLSVPQPEYEAQASQFLADTAKSSNPFFSQFAFALGKFQQAGFRAREFKSQAQLAMVHAAVEYRLRGDAGIKGVADPFGNGPFAFRRFVFKGVDRGFELKSAYAGAEAPLVMIFVEKTGPAFEILGPDAGKAITQ